MQIINPLNEGHVPQRHMCILCACSDKRPLCCPVPSWCCAFLCGVYCIPWRCYQGAMLPTMQAPYDVDPCLLPVAKAGVC